MRRLTDDEFKATYAPEVERIGLDEAPPFDFWKYFEAIPPEDFDGHNFAEGLVSYAWNMRGTAYQHVLVECETPNVFLALVLDVHDRTVVGHHLLDLNRLYGLTE
ncbi:hypothetical protein AB0C07_12465 [Actinoplanes missouriensis]|uniref:hypothetical protein n=1 Tax=Actinoplanes missouriensis TaxID=1866 RepID=UPI0033C4A139